MNRRAKYLLLLFSHPLLAAAQCCPGDIHGRITDKKGNPVAGATVSVHDCEKQPNALTTNSDQAGKFQIAGMAWGPCVVTIIAPNFRPYERTGIRGNVYGNVEFDAVLEK